MPLHNAVLARRWLAAGALMASVLGLSAIWPAVAQTPDNTIRNATLQLWPEYDDPGLLVIFSGEFTDTVSFPQAFAFPLPGSARGIQATEKQADGRLINQSWEIVNGNLTYTLPGPGFHIEYYVDRPPSGDQREINYSFEVPYKIDSLDVRVQQPARASDFSLTPPPESASVGDDGLTYSALRRTNLKPGDKLDLVLSYKKTDQAPSRPSSAAVATPSSSQVPVQPGMSASAGQRVGSWLPWLLIAVALVALVVAAVYWFSQVRTPSTRAPGAAGARSTQPGRPVSAPQASDKDTAFCTQCGQRFRPEDRFCANCGAPR
jgi:hypothetical protein